MLIVDGTLVPTRDRTVATSNKNYRYSTNHQAVIDANTRLVVAVGRPVLVSRHDSEAYAESGADRAAQNAPAIADGGGYFGTGLLIPHRRPAGGELTDGQETDNKIHRKIGPTPDCAARVERGTGTLKRWRIFCHARCSPNRLSSAAEAILTLEKQR